MHYKKPIALMVCLCLLSTGVSAAPNAEVINSLLPGLSASIGRSEESWQGQNGKTIYLIRDAHDSVAAQKNIARVIQRLVQNQGVTTVYEEGYEGEVPTDLFFQDVQNPKTRERVSRKLLEELRIGGAEYAHINRFNSVVSRESSVMSKKGIVQTQDPRLKIQDSRRDFRLIGADSLRGHLKNILDYRHAARAREEILSDLDAIQKEQNLIIVRLFPAQARKWLKLKDRFETNRLDLAEYLRRSFQIYLRVSRQTIFMERYPQLTIFLEALESKNVETIRRARNIRGREFNHELRTFEKELSESLLKGPLLERVFTDYQTVKLVRKLALMELSPDDFSEVQLLLKEFKTQRFAKFSAEQNSKTVVLSRRWETKINRAVQFYQTALSREESVSKRLQEFAGKSDETRAALVFGGFHAPQLKEILREQGFSYIVIDPVIKKISKRDGDLYRKLMAGDERLESLPSTLAAMSRVMSDFEWVASGLATVATARRGISENAYSHSKKMESRRGDLGTAQKATLGFSASINRKQTKNLGTRRSEIRTGAYAPARVSNPRTRRSEVRTQQEDFAVSELEKPRLRWWMWLGILAISFSVTRWMVPLVREFVVDRLDRAPIIAVEAPERSADHSGFSPFSYYVVVGEDKQPTRYVLESIDLETRTVKLWQTGLDPVTSRREDVRSIILIEEGKPFVIGRKQLSTFSVPKILSGSTAEVLIDIPGKTVINGEKYQSQNASGSDLYKMSSMGGSLHWGQSISGFKKGEWVGQWRRGMRSEVRRTTGLDLFRALNGKYQSRHILRGGPVIQPGYLTLNPDPEKRAAIENKDGSVEDYSSNLLFLNPADRRNFLETIQALGTGQGNPPVVFKPHRGELGRNIFFISPSERDRWLLTMAYSQSLYFQNDASEGVREIFTAYGVPTLVDRDVIQAEINPLSSDMPAMLDQIWGRLSHYQSGSYDGGMMERVMPMLRPRGRAFETRHLFVGNLLGDYERIKEDSYHRYTRREGDDPWLEVGRHGSSAYFSNLTGRVGARDFSWSEAFRPLYELYPTLRNNAAFLAYVDHWVEAEYRYLVERLRLAGLRTAIKIRGQWDFGWLEPDAASGEFPRPFLMETGIFPIDFEVFDQGFSFDSTMLEQAISAMYLEPYPLLHRAETRLISQPESSGVPDTRSGARAEMRTLKGDSVPDRLEKENLFWLLGQLDQRGYFNLYPGNDDRSFFEFKEGGPDLQAIFDWNWEVLRAKKEVVRSILRDRLSRHHKFEELRQQLVQAQRSETEKIEHLRFAFEIVDSIEEHGNEEFSEVASRAAAYLVSETPETYGVYTAAARVWKAFRLAHVYNQFEEYDVAPLAKILASPTRYGPRAVGIAADALLLGGWQLAALSAEAEQRLTVNLGVQRRRELENVIASLQKKAKIQNDVLDALETRDARVLARQGSSIGHWMRSAFIQGNEATIYAQAYTELVQMGLVVKEDLRRLKGKQDDDEEPFWLESIFWTADLDQFLTEDSFETFLEAFPERAWRSKGFSKSLAFFLVWYLFVHYRFVVDRTADDTEGPQKFQDPWPDTYPEKRTLVREFQQHLSRYQDESSVRNLFKDTALKDRLRVEWRDRQYAKHGSILDHFVEPVSLQFLEEFTGFIGRWNRWRDEGGRVRGLISSERASDAIQLSFSLGARPQEDLQDVKIFVMPDDTTLRFEQSLQAAGHHTTTKIQIDVSFSETPTLTLSMRLNVAATQDVIIEFGGSRGQAVLDTIEFYDGTFHLYLTQAAPKELEAFLQEVHSSRIKIHAQPSAAGRSELRLLTSHAIPATGQKVFRLMPVYRKVLIDYQDLVKNFTEKNHERLEELAVLAGRYPQVRFNIYRSDYDETHYFEMKKVFRGMNNVRFQQQSGAVTLDEKESDAVLHLSTHVFDTHKRFGVRTKKIRFMLAGRKRGSLAAALLYNPEHWQFRSRMSKQGDFWLLKSTLARLGRKWLADFVIASAA